MKHKEKQTTTVPLSSRWGSILRIWRIICEEAVKCMACFGPKVHCERVWAETGLSELQMCDPIFGRNKSYDALVCWICLLDLYKLFCSGTASDNFNQQQIHHCWCVGRFISSVLAGLSDVIDRVCCKVKNISLWGWIGSKMLPQIRAFCLFQLQIRSGLRGFQIV